VTELHVSDSTTSTNDEIRSLASAGAPEGTVVIAVEQTSGRGRMGRRWHSVPGLGLYVSVLIRPREPAAYATRWTLGAAVAACRACRRTAGCDVTIKWPNDLLIGRLKVAGVLAEMRGAGDAAELTIGTGINVDHAPGDFPEELRDTATSLRIAADGGGPNREELAASYLAGIGWVRDGLAEGRWDELSRRWVALAPMSRGARVRVSSPGSEAIEGTTRGIDEFGALIVDGCDGESIVVRSVDRVRWLEG